MIMKKYFKFVLLLGISLIFLAGCVSDLVVPVNDSNSPATEGSSNYENPVGELGTGKGTLKIYLTDAPGDYKEVNINISRIEGHIAVEDEEGYWEELMEWPDGLEVDLIELEDVSILLASLELEPNKYTQLRLFLMGGEGDAWLVLEGSEGPEGTTSTELLEIPSVYQTGIKLNRPFEIVAGSITKLTIDFDAEKSVIKTGNGKYKLKPVIHVSSETYSEEEEPTEGLGSVYGTVSYYGYDSEDLELILVGIGGASVSLSGGVYIFANTTTTLEDGSFSFDLDNVPAGNYTLNVYTDDYGNYSEDIEVVASGDKVVDVVFLLEEPGTILGIVVDSDSGDPIGGATVSVTLSGGSTYSFDSSTETDTDGNFSIEQLPVGVYDLTASAIDYENYTAGGIGVTEGATTDMSEIELTLLL
jgi:5-hydroxyisourate hydrolase-like protein (transthyretin family)